MKPVFRIPTAADAQKILEWRRKPRVARYQLTEVADDLKRQEEWLVSCQTRTDYLHWIFGLPGVPMGLVSISAIDAGSRSCFSGFYVGEDEYLGLGGLIPLYLQNFVFSRLPIDAIRATVFASNERVLALNVFYGFTKTKLMPAQVVKNGVAEDVWLLELTRQTRENDSRFRNYMADFPIEGPAQSLITNPGGA